MNRIPQTNRLGCIPLCKNKVSTASLNESKTSGHAWGTGAGAVPGPSSCMNAARAVGASPVVTVSSPTEPRTAAAAAAAGALRYHPSGSAAVTSRLPPRPDGITFTRAARRHGESVRRRAAASVSRAPAQDTCGTCCVLDT